MQPVHSTIHDRISFSLLRDLILFLLFLGISMFANSQQYGSPGYEVRTVRRRADTEDEKKEDKDSAQVKLSEEKKKQLPGKKRKAKALYPSKQFSLVVTNLKKPQILQEAVNGNLD